MKISALLATLALAIASTEACAKYKICWCEKEGGIAWDDYTRPACHEPGTPGYYGQNFLECYRYKASFLAFLPSKAINNCDWSKTCQAQGAATGLCREKI